MSIEQLEQAVVRWANARQIYQKSTDETRFNKLREEVEELADEIFPDWYEGRDMQAIKMEAGDVLVTLVNLLHPLGLDLEMCLKAAYEKIKDRRGQMVDGTFQREK